MQEVATSDALPVVRVGLLGAATISRKIWAALHAAGGLVVTRVGCRDEVRGNQFVLDCTAELRIDVGLPTVCSYADLISSNDVDVVYIALLVCQRSSWVHLCAHHKKHVVGEKPPAVDVRELKEWIEALRHSGCFYLDGTMLSHGLRIQEVVAAAQKLTVRHMSANFCFKASEEFMSNRFNPSMEPMGVLGDLGWYCVRYMLHMMDFAPPTSVTARVLTRKNEAIVSFAGELVWEHPSQKTVSGNFYVSTETGDEQSFIASCENGVVSVQDFCLPFCNSPVGFQVGLNSIEGSGCTVNNHEKKVWTTVEGESNTYQEVQMWRNVRDVVRTPNGAVTQKWASRSCVTQGVLDALLGSSQSGLRVSLN